jgi:hypothetical protein
MIVGINMHQASNAGLGNHHYNAVNLDHNESVSASDAPTAVGRLSTQRLSYVPTNVNGSVDDDEMHRNHQYQHFESFNSSSHQSNHSIADISMEAAVNPPHQKHGELQQQHPGILGLEHHFSQFGMQTHSHKNLDPPTTTVRNLDADNTLDVEEVEEEPVKLFVGQVRLI